MEASESLNILLKCVILAAPRDQVMIEILGRWNGFRLAVVVGLPVTTESFICLLGELNSF